MLFYSDTMAYGKKDERKLIISVWHQVFRTCNTSPAILTTQTGLHLAVTKLLQKSEMRKEIVIELSYKGFSRASDYS